jgi:hypothetical protein
MRGLVASRIMRTTIDIDAEVMRELKRRQKAEGKPLGRLVSELLATALGGPEPQPAADFKWTTRSMEALVDLEDKEALRRAMEGQ